jgi:hypothetical protein
MSTHSTENQPSFFLSVRQLGPETYIVRMSQEFFGPAAASDILHALCFWDSTPAHDPVRSSILDGSGLISNEGFCTVVPPAPPTAKPSEDRPLSSDAELAATSNDGVEWIAWPPSTSSTTTEPKSQSSDDHGQPLAKYLESLRPLMTFVERERPSLCHED